MAKKPTIEELNNPEKFERIAELSHNKIRDFVFEQISHENSLIITYMIYQVIMVLFGTFFLTRAIVLFYKGFPDQLYWTIGSAFLSFSVLVIIHELLHGFALLLTGAKRISFGANFRTFMFFAEADQHIMNRKQFTLVAMTPLFVVKILCLTGIVMTIRQPASYFFIILMSLHSLFCAGDIGLLSFFWNFKEDQILTYDSRVERKSFFFRKLRQ